MKTSIHTFRSLFLLTFFFLAMTSSYSQTKSTQPLSRSNDTSGPSISIKVYECPDGTQSLLVYNPNHPNFFFYQTPPYFVRWYQDGQLVGENAMLENVCGQNFTVEIIQYTEGWTTTRDYYMGCRTRTANH